MRPMVNRMSFVRNWALNETKYVYMQSGVLVLSLINITSWLVANYCPVGDIPYPGASRRDHQCATGWLTLSWYNHSPPQNLWPILNTRAKDHEQFGSRWMLILPRAILLVLDSVHHGKNSRNNEAKNSNLLAPETWRVIKSNRTRRFLSDVRTLFSQRMVMYHYDTIP